MDSPLGGSCFAGGILNFKYENSYIASISMDANKYTPNITDTIKDFEFTGNLTAFNWWLRKRSFS